MENFLPGCTRNQGIGMKIEKNKAISMIMNKETFLARFVG